MARTHTLANAQSGLTALEHGRHALAATTKYGADGGLSITKYAQHVGRPKQSVDEQVCAAKVYNECPHVRTLEKYFKHLVAIHAAPPEHWAESGRQMPKPYGLATLSRKVTRQEAPGSIAGPGVMWRYPPADADFRPLVRTS
jgi:hypothetical protein